MIKYLYIAAHSSTFRSLVIPQHTSRKEVTGPSVSTAHCCQAVLTEVGLPIHPALLWVHPPDAFICSHRAAFLSQALGGSCPCKVRDCEIYLLMLQLKQCYMHIIKCSFALLL